MNYWDKWTRPRSVASRELEPGQEFYCPMDPQVVRSTYEPNGDVPKCPICGMPLSVRKKGRSGQAAARASPPACNSRPSESNWPASRPCPSSIGRWPSETKTVGYVTYDESRLSRIVSRVEGYVEKLYVDKTFTVVHKGDPLAEIYSPELYSTAQELLLATKRRRSADLAASARQQAAAVGRQPAGDRRHRGLRRSRRRGW